MNKTQKTLVITAAIAGLVAGAVAKAKTTENKRSSNLAGKRVSSASVDRAACNGCGGKTSTNKVY